MKTNENANKILVALIAILVLSITAAAMTAFCKSASNSKYGVILNSLKKGDIAEESIKVSSSVDIVDYEETEIARKEAEKAVLPVFSFNSLSTIESLSTFDAFRQCLENSQYEEAKAFVSEIMLDKITSKNSYEIVGLAYDIMKKILIDGYFEYSEILSVINQGYDRISIINNYLDQVPLDGETVISIDSLTTANSIFAYVQDAVKNLDISVDDLSIIEYLITNFSSPNAIYDDYLTEIRRKDAYDNCESVIVSFKNGEEIISKDHVIKDENLYKLKLLSTNTKITLSSILGDFVFELMLVIGAVLLILYFFGLSRKKLKIAFVILDFVILSCAYLVAVTFFTTRDNVDLYVSIYPVIFVPVLAVMLTGSRKIGYSFSLLMSILFARIPGIGVSEVGYFLTVSFACCLPIRFYNKRLDMIIQYFASLALGLCATVLYILIENITFDSSLVFALVYVANLTVTYVLLAILVPVLEKIMNIPTSYRLHELAYSDSPALTRLSQIAPGTYTHSCAVADLAEAAAKAVGANALLCRVGALYHDIGKTEHPEYFVENQNGDNKHDDINPTLSASIIKNHIKVGAQKGKALGLPQEIIEMIEGHHGNDVISYFYNEAVKEGKQGSYSESDYTYDSEIPVTKECGILMLADSVEAASRTVTPNPQKYTKLIENIFLGKIERHQLSNNTLSLAELNTIKIVFIKTLLAKNHARIEYPDQEED